MDPVKYFYHISDVKNTVGSFLYVKMHFVPTFDLISHVSITWGSRMDFTRESNCTVGLEKT